MAVTIEQAMSRIGGPHPWRAGKKSVMREWCDRAASGILIHPDGLFLPCAYDGGVATQVHHVRGRSSLPSRWDFKNLIPLGFTGHHVAETDPVLFDEWMRKERSWQRDYVLRLDRTETLKPDYELLWAYLSYCSRSRTYDELIQLPRLQDWT